MVEYVTGGVSVELYALSITRYSKRVIDLLGRYLSSFELEVKAAVKQLMVEKTL